MMKKYYLVFLIFLFFFSKTNAGAWGDVDFTISNGVATSGEQVCVDVSVENFVDILSMQFSMVYDSTVLSLDYIEPNLWDLSLGSFGYHQNGVITCVWSANTNILLGETVPDGTAIFTLCFNVADGQNGMTEISFSEDPVPSEILDSQEVICYLIPHNSVVSIFPQGGCDVTFTASDEEVTSEEQVCVDVSVENFVNIIAMQYSMSYDSTKLRFSHIIPNLVDLSQANFALPTVNLPGEGVLWVSWSSDSQLLQGVTVSDGTTIFSVCFDPIENQTGSSSFSFVDEPMAMEVYDVNENIDNICYESGLVTLIPSNNSQLTITASNEVVTTDTNVCVDVSVADFNDIVSMQFSMNYNTNVLDFTEVEPVMPDLYSTNFGIYENDGGLAIAWTASNPATGVSLDDGSVIFSVCFDVVGAGGFSGFTFGNDPVVVEVYDVNLNEVIPAFNNGSVTYSPVGLSLQVDIMTIDETCNSQNGSLSASASGGTAPYTYDWSNGVTSQLVNNLSAGTYSVTVTDSAGDMVEASAIIENIAELDVDVTAPSSICLGESISISASADGGVAPYIYTWSNGETTANMTTSPNTTTTYIVTVSDANGCTGTALTTVVVNPSAFVSISKTDANCGENNGSATVVAFGCAEPYTYEWSTGATTESIYDLAPGDYSVTVTDLGGNATVATTTIENVANLSVVLSAPALINLGESAVISANANGGTAPYAYVWSQGQTTANITVSPSTTTTYTVTLTDANGCTGVASTTVVVDPNPSGSADFFLSITPESSQLAEGESMCVDVTTADFLSIASMQFTINWDESVLQLDEISNMNLDGLTENNFNQPDDGTLLLSWLDNNLLGVSVPDNSTLFSLCFTAVGTGTSNIEFSNDPVEIEVVRADLSIANVSTTDGTVTVGSNSGVAVLSTTEAVGVQGETVCTAVQLDNAQDIVGIQFSMHWDADALDFQSIENFLFDGSATIATTFSDLNTAAEEGTLLFSFTDVSTINGYNFNQATTLFELCYDIAAPSGQYPIIIDGTPNPIELIDSDLNLLSNIVDTAAVIVVDAIWPGDTNQDGLVNQYDILNIGLAYGATGPLRVSPLNWAPYPGDDWGMSTAETNVEFKHVDTDGNGSIQAADTVAMAQNWFETNHLWNGSPSPFDSFEEIRDDNTPFYIEQDTVSEGQEIVLNIILGDESTMAEDVYGLAFTIDYDETLVERNSAWAAFENSWVGNVSDDMLTFYRDDFENGKIRIGMTRIDGMDMSGRGMIGQVGITILDVIFRDNLVPMEFSIENPVIINYSEQQIPVSPSSTTSYVLTTDVVNRGLEQQLKVYPTVTDGLLKIESGDVEVLQLQLFQANGSFVSTMNMADQISVKDLNEGYYFIKFITDKGVAVKEFIKL